MKRTIVVALAVAGALALCMLAGQAYAQNQQPQVKIPNPGVPQIMTLEGQYVRAAYNNEGYAILGYRTANQSVGDEWMLLELGLTIRDGVKAFDLTRDKLSLETPDGKTLPLPTQADFQQADLRMLNQRASMVRDSINYFPPSASKACRIGFFAEQSTRAMAYDKVEMSNTRACLGRVFFKIPGGIQYGQHWLNVQFQGSLVRVPFRILTKEEDQTLSKNFGDIQKAVKEAFRPNKK